MKRTSLYHIGASSLRDSGQCLAYFTIGKALKGVFGLLICSLFSVEVIGGADSFLTPLRIGPGHAPDIVVDAENEVIHLIYIDGDGVYYRKGDMGGVFGAPEKIIEEETKGRYWYPRIVIDGNGVPHVVFCILKPNTFSGIRSYYSNRIGGEWTVPLTVFSLDEGYDKWVNFPHLVTEDGGDTVYLCCKNKKPPVFGEVAKIVDASSSPKLVLKREVEFGGITMLLLGGELHLFGGEQGSWHLFKFDKETLESTGEVVDMASGVKTEQIRAYQDETDEVHFAGATWHGENETRGFYNSLSRVREGKALIRYATTNGHHCGNGRVVRDALTPERIYNFHYSGATGGKHGVYDSFDCEHDNQVHFVRIEKGEIKSEHKRITYRDGSHGSSYRLQVAAGPHPRGGSLCRVS